MKRVNFFLIGLVVGVLIAVPASVVADNMVGKKIEVEAPVILDGEYLPVSAIGLEGTTYGPIRFLAEAFGKDVDWVDNAVVITTPSTESTEDLSDGNGKSTEMPTVEEEGNNMDHIWTIEQIDWEIGKIERSIKANQAYVDLHKDQTDLPDAVLQALNDAQEQIESDKIKLEELKRIRDTLTE